MILKEIQEIARQKEIKSYSKLNKEELIRTIQAHEGNSPCYQTITECREDSCLWRSRCQS